MQFPKVRALFIPRPNYELFYFDYSQIEMRVLALYAQEQKMLDAFKRGEDIHTATTRILFGKVDDTLRKKGKQVNFAIGYGVGKKALSKDLGMTLKVTEDLLVQYHQRFPGVKIFETLLYQHLYDLGYSKDIFLGRYHTPYNVKYKALNHLIQGTSASVLKYAIIQVNRLFEHLDIDAHLIMPIHDEIVIEINKKDVSDEVLALIKHTMEFIQPVLQYGVVTTVVDIERTTTNWKEKKKYKISEKVLDKVYADSVQLLNGIALPAPEEKIEWFI